MSLDPETLARCAVAHARTALSGLDEALERAYRGAIKPVDREALLEALDCVDEIHTGLQHAAERTRHREPSTSEQRTLVHVPDPRPGTKILGIRVIQPIHWTGCQKGGPAAPMVCGACPDWRDCAENNTCARADPADYE